MKNTSLVVLAAAFLAVPASVATVSAGQKILPPAFGTELVPEQDSKEYKGPTDEADDRVDEEKQGGAEKPPARHHAGGGGGRHGGRVRIQLDGDEDGGGDDLGGGDF